MVAHVDDAVSVNDIPAASDVILVNTSSSGTNIKSPDADDNAMVTLSLPVGNRFITNDTAAAAV